VAATSGRRPADREKSHTESDTEICQDRIIPGKLLFRARRDGSGAVQTGARLKIYETLKSYVDSDIQNMLGAYEQKYLGKLLEKFDANPKSWKRY
jgi:hypothetical protein